MRLQKILTHVVVHCHISMVSCLRKGCHCGVRARLPDSWVEMLVRISPALAQEYFLAVLKVLVGAGRIGLRGVMVS